VMDGERNEIPADCPAKSLIALCWSDNPVLRPDFEEIYSTLERLSGSTNLDAVRLSTTMGGHFAIINPIPWHMFVDVLVETMSITKLKAESLKYVLAEDDLVSNKQWNRLVERFSPLVAHHPDYQNISTLSQSVYCFQDVLSVITPRWFFGFEDMTEFMANKEDGSYAFRFSASIGCYTLCVVFNGELTHWRIQSQKDGKTFPKYFIGETQYSSLQEIITIHTVTPLPIIEEEEVIGLITLKKAVERDT